MKHMILLVITALLLSGCGLDSIPQDGLTSAIGMKGGDEAIVATNVKCDVHPWVDSHQAQVTCELDIVDDSMKLGDVLKLHLGGVLVTSDSEPAFVNETLVRSSGIVLSGFPDNVASEDELVAVLNGAGTIEVVLTAEMNDFRTPVEIVGVASMEGAKELNVPASDKNEVSTLEVSTCEGTLIPNSSLASITFTGELKDGQQIAGGGLLDTNMMPLTDMCNEVSAEGVVFQVETTFMKIGDIKGEFKLGIIRDGDSGLPIFQGVVVNHEEQYS